MNETDRKQKIYQELVEEIKLNDPKKKPNEFSAGDFAEEVKCDRKRAKNILEKKVEEGILTKRVTSHGTYYCVV